jgi:hypothetical protein
MNVRARRVVAAAMAVERRRAFRADTLCFGPQRDFVRDPSRFRVAVCSRRAGKTVACAVLLLERALAAPRSSHAYVTLSRINAKRIVWRQLLDLCKDHGLEARANETELALTLANGARIYLAGAKDSSEVEKFRGLSLATVVIDEGQSFRPYLRGLIDDVLVPCLWDTQGVLVLIGTPGPVPAGPFWDAWSGARWSRHHWTVLDNPWIERMTGRPPADILREERERRGIDETDPTYQRESLGRWVRDDSALVFRYDPARNAQPAPVGGAWRYVLGVDLGLEDADAIAVLGWLEGRRELYLVEEDFRRGQDITGLFRRIENLRAKYDPQKIVVDFGGLGKKIGEEARRRWHIPVEAADKARKLEHIALLNDALRTAAFHAPATSRFAEEAALVQWEPEARGVRIAKEPHGDMCDAVLYAYRAAAHYLEQPAAPAVDPGDLWEQRALEQHERKRSAEWWE